MDLTEPQRDLRDLMSDASERMWFAGWFDETEYRLWAFMSNPDDDGQWGRETIPVSLRFELRELSQRIGGWIYYHSGGTLEEWGERFITTAEWLPMFSAEIARRTQAGKKW